MTKQEAKKEKNYRLHNENFENKYPRTITRTDLNIEEITESFATLEEYNEFHELLKSNNPIKKLIYFGKCNLDHTNKKKTIIPLIYKDYEKNVHNYLKQIELQKGAVN